MTIIRKILPKAFKNDVRTKIRSNQNIDKRTVRIARKAVDKVWREQRKDSLNSRNTELHHEIKLVKKLFQSLFRK